MTSPALLTKEQVSTKLRDMGSWWRTAGKLQNSSDGTERPVGDRAYTQALTLQQEIEQHIAALEQRVAEMEELLDDWRLTVDAQRLTGDARLRNGVEHRMYAYAKEPR